jgi:ankyrin repeat domain-containing protein 50
MASICISTLKLSGFPDSSVASLWDLKESFRRNHLLEYSYYNWAYHANQCESPDAINSNILRFFLDCRSFPLNISELHHDFSRDFTPLHLAAFYNLPHILTSLAKAGYDPTAQTPQTRWTPLMVAASQGHSELVKKLLPYSCIRPKGIQRVREALKKIKKHLPTKPLPVNAVNIEGATALFLASQSGFIDVVETLLSAPGIDCNIAETMGRTPLMRAAGGGHLPVVKALLRVPDVDVNASDSVFGMTPLIRASSAGHSEVVKVLVRENSVRVNQADKYGKSALAWAARKGYLDIVRIFLCVPGIEVNTADEDGDTALIRAARRGQQDVVQALLEHPGINVNARDKNRYTAMDWARQKAADDLAYNPAEREAFTSVVQLLSGFPGVEAE